MNILVQHALHGKTRRGLSSHVKMEVVGVITINDRERKWRCEEYRLNVFLLRSSGQGTWNCLGCLSLSISNRMKPIYKIQIIVNLLPWHASLVGVKLTHYIVLVSHFSHVMYFGSMGLLSVKWTMPDE